MNDQGRAREIERPDSPGERAAEHAAETIGLGLSRPAPSNGSGGPTDSVRVPSVVDSVLRSPGRPLDSGARAFLEPRVGHDLGALRIHSGPRAAEAASKLDAIAFTEGTRIVLGELAPSPASLAGRRLLAHEVTHALDDSQGPGVLHRKISASLPPQQLQRVVTTLTAIVARVPAVAPEGTDQSGAEPQAGEAFLERYEFAARETATYLVETENLDGEGIDSLLAYLRRSEPVLLQAVAFGGLLFRALHDAGVIGLASSVLWYAGLTIRDTIAGDFVKNPTAAAIILRTLLTLIPGIDQIADAEDLVANLLYGILDPATELASLGWWFAVVCTLIGLFPEFGSAVSGVLRLMGRLARDGVTSLVPRLLKLIGEGGQLLADVRGILPEVLAMAEGWKNWVLPTFLRIVDWLIEQLSTTRAMAAGGADWVLGGLRAMRDGAREGIGQAVAEVMDLIRRTLESIGVPLPSPAKAVRRELTEAQRADAFILGERTKTTLTKRFERPTRPRDFDTATTELTKAMAGAPEEIREAAHKLLGNGEAEGLLGFAADALRRPVGYAAVLERLDGIRIAGHLPKTIEGYAAAAVQLARDRGKTVLEIYVPADKRAVMVREFGSATPGEPLGGASDPLSGLVDADEFMKHLSGTLFVDNAFDVEKGSHGSLTHLIQYLVLDDAFKAAGTSADAFFELLNTVSLKLNLSDQLWVGVLDPLQVAVGDSMAQPETIWPILRDLMLDTASR